MANYQTKHSDDIARVCRALHVVIRASFRQIGDWTGIDKKAVAYICRRRILPPDDEETSRAILRWWLLQQLPTRVHAGDGSADESADIIRRFNECIEDAQALKRSQAQ